MSNLSGDEQPLYAAGPGQQPQGIPAQQPYAPGYPQQPYPPPAYPPQGYPAPGYWQPGP